MVLACCENLNAVWKSHFSIDLTQTGCLCIIFVGDWRKLVSFVRLCEERTQYFDIVYQRIYVEAIDLLEGQQLFMLI